MEMVFFGPRAGIRTQAAWFLFQLPFNNRLCSFSFKSLRSIQFPPFFTLEETVSSVQMADTENYKKKRKASRKCSKYKDNNSFSKFGNFLKTCFLKFNILQLSARCMCMINSVMKKIPQNMANMSCQFYRKA